MAVRKLGTKLNDKKETRKVNATVATIEPKAEEVYEDEFFEEDEFDEEFEDEIVDEEFEDEIIDGEEAPKEIKKVTKKLVKESKGKEIFQKVEAPRSLVVEGKVTKRDDLLKIVLEELESKGMTTTLTNLDTVFKAIENAISYSLDNGAPVFFLGNQITIKERAPRVANVPKQDYDTLTDAYIAYKWSKLGDRKTVRGKYNKDTKEFKAEDGTVYKLD